MDMTPQVDHEAVTFARPMEQPEGRFGANHIARNKVPDLNPEVSSFAERQEVAEAEEAKFLATMAQERLGTIALADTVTVPSNGSYYL